MDPSPRVPAEPGGDFVDTGGDGLSDCDAHGTLTASIICRPAAVTDASPETNDAFIGVAPDARLLSMR